MTRQKIYCGCLCIMVAGSFFPNDQTPRKSLFQALPNVESKQDLILFSVSGFLPALFFFWKNGAAEFEKSINIIIEHQHYKSNH